MFKNLSYDLYLPSKCPQISELNGGLFVHNASLHRTKDNMCACQTYKS